MDSLPCKIRYLTLTAVMGGAFDLLANPEGYAGVGPGAVTMGISFKDWKDLAFPGEGT